MIGQKELLSALSAYSIDTFPHSVLLLGEHGCGKHTLVTEIANNILKLPLIDITENVSDEYIDKIYRSPTPAIYLIDMSSATERKQNSLLKFVEEPSRNAFVILLSETANTLLNTILNRCVIFTFSQYSDAELSNFIEESSKDKSEIILSLCRTPGKIKELNVDTLDDLLDLCEKVIDKIHLANLSNTLTIADKMNYSDEYSKFNLDLFMEILLHLLLEKYQKKLNDMYFKMYQLVCTYQKKLLDRRVNRKIFMNNFLVAIWKLARTENGIK